MLTFFEKWIGFIVNEPNLDLSERSEFGLNRDDYFYRVNFPKEYQTAIYIKKFEKDYSRFLEYRFLKAYPISINSMPVSYDVCLRYRCALHFCICFLNLK